MPRSVSIAKVTRSGGKIHVMFPNKTGMAFASAAEAQAVLEAFRDAFSSEVLVTLALAKVGAANAGTLEGKTVTVSLDVVIE